MKFEYGKKVVEFSEYLRQHSNFTDFILAAVCIYIFLPFGFSAGNIGGAILFTIAGIFYGMILSKSLPEVTIMFFETKLRLILFVLCSTVFIFVSIKTTSLLIDSIILSISYLFLLYIYYFKAK